MRAIVRDSLRAGLTTRPAPRRPSGWVTVRVLLVGVCRTDVHAADGLLPLGGPRILGHELVGDVVEADEESGWARGDRVVACPLLRCGACAGCASHLRCVEPRMLGVDVDGAFADEVVVPADSLYGVPPSLPLRRAAYVEPIAATLAVSRAPITPGSRGLVLGRGRIADLTTRVLRHLRFTVESPRPDEPPGAFDFVVETAGTQASLDEALHHVRPAGAVVLKSRPPGRVGLDVARAVRNDVRLFAVSYGQWPIAARLASELPIDDLLGDVYAIERFDAAMALTREQPLGPKLFLELGRGG